jgi:large subunit ribosomal protein L16
MSKIAPSRTRYRKQQKGRIYGNAKGGDFIAFGDFALQTLERGRLTGDQLEAARVAINRTLKRTGHLFMRVFPHKPYTKKPAETRMGRGKGPVEGYEAPVRPGVILFEVSGVPASLARQAFNLGNDKLPVRCRFISREALAQF